MSLGGEIRVVLAGDTMLGRGVAAEIRRRGTARGLFAPEIVEEARAADLVLLNLECCVSERGEPWPDPAKPFFFRAPPLALEALAELGVDCVTLANNHTLDFGTTALLDTLRHLDEAGIARVGAGEDVEEARRPAVLRARGLRVAVIGVTDHPADYAAGPGHPGVAYADLWNAPPPDWLLRSVTGARDQADAVVVTPHWGPNLAPSPVPHVRTAAAQLVAAGATLVAGHSAHVFHGAVPPVLYDLGDFIDDYAVDPELRNDLGLLWTVTLRAGELRRVEALPLRLDYARTRLAEAADRAWIARRLRRACAELGTPVTEEDGRLVVGA
jgi:poly-gamma-glutamate capsule biosynthesis protein CapA/YwtB (metallophosphatase superfamily)